MNQSVEDGLGAPISVGARVLYGDPETAKEIANQTGTVTAISSYDIDHDDDLGKPVLFTPRVTVKFDNGDEVEVTTYDVTPITWARYPDGPDEYVFGADDLALLPA